VRFGALIPKVAAWRPLQIVGAADLTAVPPTTHRMQADFRLVAERILGDPPKDDPLDVQRKVDRAIRTVLVVSSADLR
jgi:hypothetical protein